MNWRATATRTDRTRLIIFADHVGSTYSWLQPQPPKLHFRTLELTFYGAGKVNVTQAKWTFGGTRNDFIRSCTVLELAPVDLSVG